MYIAFSHAVKIYQCQTIKVRFSDASRKLQGLNPTLPHLSAHTCPCTNVPLAESN